ncbi:MAG: DNA polymerase III subunit beta [Brevinematia bacterium]
MKFTINRELFLRYLTIADTVLKNVKSPLAILLNVYLEVQADGTLIIMSYNGENGVKIELNVKVEEPGKITLLSKKLLDVIRKIEEGEIVFETIPDNETSVIIHPLEKEIPIFNLNGIIADAYPVFFEFNWETYIKISEASMKELIDSTVFAVAEDFSKPAFTGVYIEEAVEGRLTFVTSDGKRLATNSREYVEKKGIVPLNIIIPENIIRTLSNSFTVSSEGEVMFSVEKNQAFFRLNNVYLFSNLIEGKFPNYRDVIPKDRINVGSVDGHIFLNAIEVVSVLADVETYRIKIEIKDSIMEISARHSIHGLAREEIPLLSYSGTPIFLYCNYKHLTDFLKIFNNKVVNFSINSQVSPILFTIDGEPDFVYVDMPLRLPEE